MSEYDLKQVKADLDTIRTVAGISEQPMRHDFLGSLLVAVAGLIAASWAMLSEGVWQIWGFAAMLLPVGYLIRLPARHGKGSGSSPQIRREFAAAGSVLLFVAPFAGYALWAQRMGIRPMLVLATTVFFVGMLMLNGVVARPRHPGLVPWCLALMVGALVMPSTALSPVRVIGLMLAAGGFASACVIGIQLRQGVPDGLPG
ncbi:MAG TPA: hypothetical protein VKY85_26540 [Candidatus Angelobacter sp.]|nr:hypothetical protein [Candidatus Angelobacter sp.]